MHVSGQNVTYLQEEIKRRIMVMYRRKYKNNCKGNTKQLIKILATGKESIILEFNLTVFNVLFITFDCTEAAQFITIYTDC